MQGVESRDLCAKLCGVKVKKIIRKNILKVQLTKNSIQVQ